MTTAHAAQELHNFDPAKAFSLHGQTAIVTGGGRGIGAAIAEGLARSGAFVAVFDKDQAAAEQVAAQLSAQGFQASAHKVDVTDEASVIEAMDAVVAKTGRLDCLINNAGLAIRRPSIELDLKDWEAVLSVNLTGVFLCARQAARHMLTRKSGVIINTASIMGLSGGGLYPNISYQSTKGAVVNLTRSLAVEWARDGIRVNAIAPTWVRTDFIKPLTDNPELLARMEAMTPMGKIAEVSDIVGGVIYLASPAASMVTGHILAIDGGFLAQ
jgi:NAD(P)-dependent dehydrogenase (short-subunit alcohol dehydrogenase family)